MLGESKAGTHNQSTAPSGATSAPVWQLERNAYSAIGGNGDGIAALCGIVAWAAGAALSPLLEPDLAAGLLCFFPLAVLIGPPRVRASPRTSQPGGRPPSGPTTRARMGAL